MGKSYIRPTCIFCKLETDDFCQGLAVSKPTDSTDDAEAQEFRQFNIWEDENIYDNSSMFK